MNDKYILDEAGNPVVEPDLIKWATWFEKSHEQRRIGLTYIGKYHVSTVFLGLDYSFGHGNEPLLFETMTFENEMVEETWVHDKIKTFKHYPELKDDEVIGSKRYSTREEALKGHAEICKQITDKYGV